jgi:hypothetical protein
VTFEVPISAVSRSRSRRGVAAVAGLSSAIVVGAVVLGVIVPYRPAAPDEAVAPAPAAAAVIGSPVPPGGQRLPTIPRIVTASVARPLPGRVQCHDVDDRQCRRVIRAALRVLPADLPDVSGAAVWRSLVCNDNFDCPPDYLRDSDSLGSVTMRFADDSPSVSVNVVDWRYGTSIRLGLRAWIARSVPVSD